VFEGSAHPEKVESFVNLRCSTTIPIAPGEHFYGRWEVGGYLEANGLFGVNTACCPGFWAAGGITLRRGLKECIGNFSGCHLRYRKGIFLL
jgi:L-alanine-DL-glutamate epimerase-like enolase superfamily enzyme